MEMNPSILRRFEKQDNPKRRIYIKFFSLDILVFQLSSLSLSLYLSLSLSLSLYICKYI